MEEDLKGFVKKNNIIIDAHGHSCVHVMGDSPRTTVTYSVGLSDVGWPELLVMGLNDKTSGMIINSVATYLKAREIRPYDGMAIKEALSVLVTLKEVPANIVPQYYKVALGRAVDKGQPLASVTGLQIVWPDDKGYFPWDKNYNAERFDQLVIKP